MVDNDPNNEEYKLDDLDLLASEPEDQLQPEDESSDSSSQGREDLFGGAKPWENPILRKGAFAVAGLVLIFLCYKMIHAVFGGHDSKNQIKPVAVSQNTFKQALPQQSTVSSVAEGVMRKKLSSLEQAQSDMSVTFQTVNNQITSINSEMSDVSSKITALSANVAALAEKLDAQTHEMERLAALNAKRHMVRHSHAVQRHPANAPEMYSIQALIPGRAWLISSNGSSITVREGSSVAGYGVVKVIDVERGRVLMSSGRVIKFGQVDS